MVREQKSNKIITETDKVYKVGTCE